MPGKAFGLAAVKVRTARPGEYADGNRLRLVVRPTDARFCIVAFAISVFGCCFAARAEEASVQSGNYGGLIVGYELKGNIVSGYFNSETGNGQFTCMFYLKGKFENNLAKVESYFPGIENDKILGQLFAPAPTHLLISLKKEHGGCWNVWHFADQTPADFDLIKAYPWKSVRVVRAAKAYFYDSPQTAHHRKAYLVKSDGVGVRSQKNGWLEVDYARTEKPVSGWMKESDFFPAR
jgi:hypothetical protein